MSDIYPDIEYDEKTRRTNRLMKLVGIPICVALIGGCAVLVSRLDISPDNVAVINDSSGSIVCYKRYEDRGNVYVQDAGRLRANQQAKVLIDSVCSVFTSSGSYQACLAIKNTTSGELRVSEADRSVSAEKCVYLR
jgi:hypothetical protein